MKIHRYDSGPIIRRTLIGMITDLTVLARIAPKWDGRLFAAPAENLIAGWCIDHHQKNNEPPHKGIRSYFDAWAEDNRDESTVESVGKLLGSMSDELVNGTGMNPNVVLAGALKLFRKNRLSQLRERIDSALEAGHVEKADQIVTEYSKLEDGIGVGINLLTDKEAIRAAFVKERHEALIEYDIPAIDQFLRMRLRRGSFISFMAPEKVGKTTWQVDLAVRALQQRRRVAFIEIGDETEDELHERILVRLCRHPFESDDNEWPFTVKIPSSMSYHRGDKNASVRWKDRTFTKPINFPLAWKKCGEFQSQSLKSKKPYLKTACYPSMMIGVSGIRALLEGWSLEGWDADAVFLDYADNLASPAGKLEFRDQINRNWQLLRSISQDKNVLLVTATQANRESYDRRLLDRRHVSDDKRKLAHATAVIGLNVWGNEKDLGITRLNMVVGRKGRYSSKRPVHVAGCWAIGNPAVQACW